jgi:predicted TIM-barrel fold metal-dependent hydrolase
MPYAEGRTFYDADSHLMEVPGWLEAHADAATRESLRPIGFSKGGAVERQVMSWAELDTLPRSPDDEAAFMKMRGWQAIGAVSPSARSHAVDLLGVDKQLVFATFAATQFLGDDLDLLYGGAAAHNRAMADFCHDDPRLVAVGLAPLDDPERAVLAVAEAIDLGCGAVLVPYAPPRTHSPTHPDLDGVWDTLQEAGVPFMVHVGFGGQPLRSGFRKNGRPQPPDHLGGGENVRAKDYMVLHHPAEAFLACMTLDGIFERFPRLRGGCIELGAMWVVPLLRRLDLAQEMFKRTEPDLAALPERASDYLRRQMKFTPFVTEPVGWLIEQAGEELFLFSTDYPHPEGGRDPLGRFEASLGDASAAARDRFYAGNFAEMMGLDQPAGIR